MSVFIPKPAWMIFKLYSFTIFYFFKLNYIIFICEVGLQDMVVCTFDDPILCNYDTVGTTGTAYNWWRNEDTWGKYI